MNRPEARLVAQLAQGLAQNHLDGELHHGHAGHLRQEGDGATGARVHLQHVDLGGGGSSVAVARLGSHDHVLHVHQATNAKGGTDALGIVGHEGDFLLGEPEGRVNGHGVARVYAGAFDVLHDAGDERLRAVADGVDLGLDAVQVFIDEDGFAGGDRCRFADVTYEVARVLHDLHRAPPEHVAGPDEHRVADALGR